MAPSGRIRASMTVTTSYAVSQTVVSSEERETLDSIRRKFEASKPANTIKAYKGPQAEWYTWCLSRALKNGRKPLEEYPFQKRIVEETARYAYIHFILRMKLSWHNWRYGTRCALLIVLSSYKVQVDGEKLALFLGTEVVNRKHKRRGRVGVAKKAAARAEEEADDAGDRSDSEDEGDNVSPMEGEGAAEEGAETAGGKKVGAPTIRNYVNAIVNLWEKRQSVSNGQIAHPRTYVGVKELLATLSRQEAERKKSHHNNRRDGKCFAHHVWYSIFMCRVRF